MEPSSCQQNRRPPNARDAEEVRRYLEEELNGRGGNAYALGPGPDAPEGGRWLCFFCSHFEPMPVAPLMDPDDEPCAACGDSRDMHFNICRSMFDTGCGMAWADVFEDQVGLMHCPCDGYQPPDTPPVPPAGQGNHSPCFYRRQDQQRIASSHR